MLGKNPLAAIGSATILAGLLLFFSLSASLPVKDWTFWAASPLLALVHGIGGVFAPRGSLETMAAENQKLKAENAELEALRSSNTAFKKALGFEEEGGRRLLLAAVSYYGAEAGKEFLVVNRGKEAGISTGVVAVDENGLFVGVVRDVGERFSKIEIASNPGEAFEVEVLPLKIKALARGIGNHTIALELLPIDAPVQSGDYVFLLGIGNEGGARYHIPLGEVLSVKKNGSSAFKDGGASLLAKPETLREVYFLFSPKSQ